MYNYIQYYSSVIILIILGNLRDIITGLGYYSSVIKLPKLIILGNLGNLTDIIIGLGHYSSVIKLPNLIILGNLRDIITGLE